MTVQTITTETTEELAKRYVTVVGAVGVDAAIPLRDQLLRRWREEGLLDEQSMQHLVLCLQPGGEKEVLPGESREQAVARLMRHYGWDERTAAWTIALSEGWSDVVPEDDEGNPVPYFKVRDELEAAEAAREDAAGRPESAR